MKLLLEKWKKFIKETASLSSGTFLRSYKNIQDAGINFDTLYKDLEKHFGPNWEKELLPRHGADRKFGREHLTALKKLAQKTQSTDLLNLVGGAAAGSASVSSSSPFYNPSKGKAKVKVKPKSDPETPQKQAGSAPIQLGDARIAAVGDSITKGVGAGGRSYIDILGGQKFAIGGKASFNLWGKFRQAINSKPEYLIIFMGINNPFSGRACGSDWKNGLIGDLRGMYNEARQNGIKVVGVSLLPAVKIWRSHYNKCRKNPSKYGCCKNNERRNPNTLYDKILEVNNFILSSADIPIDTSDMYDHNGLLRPYNADGIHLNRNGHQHLANKIAAAIG